MIDRTAMTQSDAKEAYMHIIIAENDVSGGKMINRLLTMEGFEVSRAESGSHAITLLKENRTNIVLMNVFHCMYSSGVELKLTIRQVETFNSTLLVTCGAGEEGLQEFISPEDLCCAAVFELPPTILNGNGVNRILQMCNALRQSTHLPPPEGNFNWRRFVLLMHLPTEAYLGCRLLR
jgi:hypothetical protein